MTEYYYPETYEAVTGEAYDVGGGWADDVAAAVSGAVDSVSDVVGGAWEWVNDQADTYIWDTGTDLGVLEGYVRDFVNVEDREGMNFFDECIYEVEEVVNTYVWDASEHEAWLERQVNNMMDNWLGRGGKIIDEVEEVVDDVVDDVVRGGGGAVKTVTEVVERTVQTGLGDIKIDLDFGLGWLAERIEDIMAIPAKLMFSMFVEFFFEEVEE